MRSILAGTIILAQTAFLPTAAVADEVALKCLDLVIPLEGAPDGTVIEFHLKPADILKQCSPIDGAALSLISPSVGIDVQSSEKGTQITHFIVRDAKGREGTAKIIVTRE